jgi:cell division septal protein FtsQ
VNGPLLHDHGERTAFIAGQRVGRVNRRRARRALPALSRLGLLAVGLLVLAAPAAGIGWLVTAPRFAVTSIDVEGISRVPAARVRAAAAIAPGTNVWRIDPGTVIERVEAVPEIQRAEVIRRYPNRVTIVVEERRPFTLVHAGRLHWIDEEGVRMAPESRAVTIPLPVISGLTDDEIASASKAPSERVLTGVRLIRTLLRAGSPLVQQISEVDVGRSDGPVLYTVDGIEVRLGAEEWDSRIPRLAGVLAQVASSGQPVSAIDLRFRDQVVLKPAVR